MQEALHTNFKISIFSLVPAALVLVLAIFKRPVLPTLFWGIASSLLTAGIVQENWNLTQWFQSMYFGVKLPIEQKEVAWIINRGGIESMLFTISLVIIALMLGGVLKASGIIEAFEKKLHSLSLKKRGLSILATFMAILVNFLTGEQYLSLLIPGQLLKENFEKANVSKTYLTRSLEDGGTLVNPLVPWGVCGAFISTQLGVSVISYAPYACFLYLGPIFTIIFAFRGEKDYL
jgi:NhaC family Na+:H+ antiporter